MTMPKQKYWLCGILILLLLISPVSAQNEESADLITETAGITPDNIFYGLDLFFDEVIAFLTPTPLGKAEVRLNIMQERMAEMEVMASMNKTAEAKTAELEVQKQIKNFESSVENIKKKDAPKLNDLIQTHAEKLEIWQQRLKNYDIPDYADAIAEALVLLETTENVIVNIPEDLGPDSTFIISSMCKEAGATTVAECNEMISSGALTARVGILPANHTDPHNCSGFWASSGTKWCCGDSDRKYSPEYVENTISKYGHVLDNYYYRKGTVEYKIINLGTEEVEEGIETDSCDGNMLTEWFCPRVMNPVTRNERYSEEYECPNGCANGACIGEDGPEEIVECTDSDGGKDYFTKGTTTGKSLNNVVGPQIDHCLVNSTLGEFFCEDNVVSLDAYDCPNGCEDGTCIHPDQI